MLCLRQGVLHSSSNCNSISGGSCLIFCHTVVVSRRDFLLVLVWVLFGFFFVLFVCLFGFCFIWGGGRWLFGLRWFLKLILFFEIIDFSHKTGPVFHNFVSFSEVVISILLKYISSYITVFPMNFVNHPPYRLEVSQQSNKDNISLWKKISTQILSTIVTCNLVENISTR